MIPDFAGVGGSQILGYIFSLGEPPFCTPKIKIILLNYYAVLINLSLQSLANLYDELQCKSVAI